MTLLNQHPHACILFFRFSSRPWNRFPPRFVLLTLPYCTLILTPLVSQSQRLATMATPSNGIIMHATKYNCVLTNGMTNVITFMIE